MLAEMTVPLKLGNETYTMRFTGNTMVAYEEATDKFFMDTVSSLYDVVFPKGHVDDEGRPTATRVTGLELVRKISIKELRALLWATLHDYDDKGDPVWPLTVTQVGSRLNFQNISYVFIRFLTGVSANSPSGGELGEPAAAPMTPPDAAGREGTTPDTGAIGGGTGIALPAGALD